jgi:hypothetical protein
MLAEMPDPKPANVAAPTTPTNRTSHGTTPSP